jgi:hypothetical protein
MLSALAHAYARAGQRKEAQQLLSQLEAAGRRQYVSPYYLAIVHVGLGEKEQALSLLQKASTDRSNGLIFMAVEPELDPIRSDPRFIAVQQSLRLPTSKPLVQ